MKTFEVKQYRNARDDTVYEDVLSHCKKPETRESRYTNAHETSHYISSELRQSNPGKVNGFYILNNMGVIVEEPNITIKDVSEYVPNNLRGMRYKLYFVDQLRYWNNNPLYILEEFNCYILGGMTAIDDFKKGVKLERTDAVAGCFEFMIYSIALARCIKDKDQDYWNKNIQFKDFLCFELNRAMFTYKVGRNIEEFKSQSSDNLHKAFDSSREGDLFKEFYCEINMVNWTLDDVF